VAWRGQISIIALASCTFGESYSVLAATFSPLRVTLPLSSSMSWNSMFWRRWLWESHFRRRLRKLRILRLRRRRSRLVARVWAHGLDSCASHREWSGVGPSRFSESATCQHAPRSRQCWSGHPERAARNSGIRAAGNSRDSTEACAHTRATSLLSRRRSLSIRSLRKRRRKCDSHNQRRQNILVSTTLNCLNGE